jgi:hypothetical protein
MLDDAATVSLLNYLAAVLDAICAHLVVLAADEIGEEMEGRDAARRHRSATWPGIPPRLV